MHVKDIYNNDNVLALSLQQWVAAPLDRMDRLSQDEFFHGRVPPSRASAGCTLPWIALKHRSQVRIKTCHSAHTDINCWRPSSSSQKVASSDDCGKFALVCSRQCDIHNLKLHRRCNNIVSYELIWIHRTCDYIKLNVHYCMLFRSRVRIRIRFGVWLIDCDAHVFVQL